MTKQHRRRPRPGRVRASGIDHAFDALVPADVRHLSQAHWTPIGVAIRAVSLLAPTRSTRVLDVGAGVGKFCAVGAMSSLGLWCGVEQHEDLVRAARRLARWLGVADRAEYLHGDALAIDWAEFDAVYLYNPFEVPLVPDALTTQERAVAFEVQVARVKERLASLRGGTRVLTFNGFGGAMPASYELVYHERSPLAGLDLALWTQRSRRQRGRDPS
ncbi:MAG: hypothetical protein IPL61_17230 [Myxococcales bacterium]|nr:hypothetical protein [Myxococcales bacterium]